jgi:hypothetical protein
MAERSKNDHLIDFLEPLIQYVRHYEHHTHQANEAWAGSHKLLREWLALQPRQETALAWLKAQPFAPMGLVIPQGIVNAVATAQPAPTILPAPRPPVQALGGWGDIHSHRNAAGLSPEPEESEWPI